ncbi:IPExxxVDY family protein [Flavobacteriaceae bacterium R38]|nr:IPExxxVDY family protein [Flavobacteriaceae bacterium R38]
MAIHKILDDIYQPTYTLIAIHSHLEDYQLAYFLNQQLNSKFKKTRYNIDFNDEISFGIFEWDDIYQDTLWNLITNTSIVQVHQKTSTNLFNNSESYATHYLIPEHKNVDYFLKIDNGGTFQEADCTLKKVNKIPQITTAYQIDPNELKSKNNLIF